MGEDREIMDLLADLIDNLNEEFNAMRYQHTYEVEKLDNEWWDLAFEEKRNGI